MFTKETPPFKSVSQNYLDTQPHRSLGCLKLKYLSSQQKCHQGRLLPGGMKFPWSVSAPRNNQQGKPSGASGRIGLVSCYLVASKWKFLLLFLLSEIPIHSLGNPSWRKLVTTAGSYEMLKPSAPCRDHSHLCREQQTLIYQTELHVTFTQWLYVCVHMYIYRYTYTYIDTQPSTCLHIHTHTHTHTHTHI